MRIRTGGFLHPAPRKAAAMMAALLPLALCLALAGRLRADELEPLGQNGFVFTTAGEPCPLRVADLPDLLSMPAERQEQALDRAGLLGFNAISFECPLFGGGGLYASPRAQPDPAFRQALVQALARLRVRLLYPMPALWTEASTTLLEQSLGLAPGDFFTDPRALKWQAYQLQGLASLSDAQGATLPAFEGLGAWIVYKGPAPASAQAFSGWAEAQVTTLRGLGLGQLAGAWFWPGSGTAKARDEALFGWMAQASGLGSLGFVAAQDSRARDFYAACAEQGWRSLDVPLLACLPLAPGEDSAQALAGCLLPLPEPAPDAEGVERPLWADQAPSTRFELHPVALAFAEVTARLESPGQALLSLRVNRPASLRLAWGRALPMQHHLVSLDPGLVHEADLPGVKQGERILVEARAESERFGRAVLRPTWVVVQAALPAEDRLDTATARASRPKILSKTSTHPSP